MIVTAQEAALAHRVQVPFTALGPSVSRQDFIERLALGGTCPAGKIVHEEACVRTAWRRRAWVSYECRAGAGALRSEPCLTQNWLSLAIVVFRVSSVFAVSQYGTAKCSSPFVASTGALIAPAGSIVISTSLMSTENLPE